MAEPTEDCRLTASIDLSPLGGKLSVGETVRVEQPPPDILERRLAEFAGEDPEARKRAVRDLYRFRGEKDAKRIAAAMVATLDGEDEWARRLALCVLDSHTKEAAAHADRILRVLTDVKRSSAGERALAAKVLSFAAPRHPGLVPALEEARKDRSERLRKAAEKALRRCAEKD